MTSQYAQLASKRQKTTRDVVKVVEPGVEFFPGVPTVEYRPEAGPEDTLSYRHYNATERVHGRPMEDWLRPALSFGDAFPRSATGVSPWDDASTSTSSVGASGGVQDIKEASVRRVRAAFELLAKLGWKLWTAQDRDLAGDVDALDDANRQLDDVVEVIAELQLRTGVKPLWIAADLSSHPRYACGALSSPDAQVAAHAGAQLRKCVDVCAKLGADNCAVRAPREGYACALDADVTRDLHACARILKMASAYKERAGFRGQLLLDATCRRPGDGDDVDAFHRYDGDALSALCLLKHFNLERSFKLSVSPGHQLHMAAAYGALGSIELPPRSSLPSLDQATLLMKALLEQGVPHPGGLNLGVRVRGPSDAKELATAHVAHLDVYARALRSAARLVADGAFAKNLQQRYLSFHTGFGSRLASGEASLEECDEHARKQRCVDVSQNGRGRAQHWQAVFSRYL